MRHRRTAALLTLILSALLTVRLSAQGDLDRLALRFASMTAVTGLEQAMTDSLRALFPGSMRDRAGNVTLTLGQGSPKRLCTCPLDEVGYAVGNILPDGFLRSEEHTSELQSQSNLVCRLLLEKKKQKTYRGCARSKQ